MPDLHTDELHATLDRLTKLHANATPGTWEPQLLSHSIWAEHITVAIKRESVDPKEWQITADRWHKDAEFIAEAHNAFPSLASYIASLEAKVAAATEAITAAREWINKFGEHSPIEFGGEADLFEKLDAALASMNTEQETP